MRSLSYLVDISQRLSLVAARLQYQFGSVEQTFSIAVNSQVVVKVEVGVGLLSCIAVGCGNIFSQEEARVLIALVVFAVGSGIEAGGVAACVVACIPL